MSEDQSIVEGHESASSPTGRLEKCPPEVTCVSYFKELAFRTYEDRPRFSTGIRPR